ncbi:SOS response-associated peptidase [Bordetella bronchialis]|uniref:SOS response-associated peptidase n=1 Tax=Bordetella bronchialis TaxID=463025 RepID=UPI003D07F18E
MCSHYSALKKAEQLERYFRARGIPIPKSDMWPRYPGVFVRRPPEWDSGDDAVPEREAVVGRWGLISAMTRADNADKAQKLSTFNARSESAAKSFTFGNAWRRGQRCLIPAENVFEPDWRSGKAVATRFTRTDGAPLGIAGLWDKWRSPAGEWIESFTMLTINADQHPLFKDYHRPGDEKRMVVILPDGAYGDWLAGTGDIRDFLQPYPADQLVAEPVVKTAVANPEE